MSRRSVGRPSKKTLRVLEDLGHRIEEVRQPYDGLALARAYFILYFGEVAVEVDALATELGRPLKKHDIELSTRTLSLLGHAFSAKEFAMARKYWHQLSVAMGTLHQTFDLYLTPTIAELPPKIGSNKPQVFEKILMQIINALRAGRLLKALGVVDKLASDNMAKMPFTQVANMTGQPAMSVPIHWTAENIPVGVQFIAANGREDLLFQLAAQLERAMPWGNRRPVI